MPLAMKVNNSACMRNSTTVLMSFQNKCYEKNWDFTFKKQVG